MARTLTYCGRMTFWGGVRSLLSVDAGWAFGQSFHVHVLGFGFGVIYLRGLQASLRITLPFYTASWYRLPNRHDKDGAAPTPELVDTPQQVQEDLDERNGRADRWASRTGLVQED